MKILIACEESQRVCIAFRKRGFKAFSCDILPCSGGHPEWHIQGDVLEHLNDGWDVMIAHPPCTYLSHAGCKWLYPKGVLNQERYAKGLEGKEFFLALLNANIPMIAIENPFSSPVYGMPPASQKIQPYMFGHPVQKKTLLWLKGLPNLQVTQIVKPEYMRDGKGIQHSKWFMQHFADAKERSKTFEGIAEAMADQWGSHIQRQTRTEVLGAKALRTPPTTEVVGIRAGDIL